MKVQVWCWRCEAVKNGVLCGHTWICASELPPHRCAKCKSAHWNVTKPLSLNEYMPASRIPAPVKIPPFVSEYQIEIGGDVE